MTGPGCMAKIGFRLTAQLFISECWGYTCAPPGCSCLTCPSLHPPPSLPSLLAFHSCFVCFSGALPAGVSVHKQSNCSGARVPCSHLAALILDSNSASKLSAVGQFKSRSRQSVPFTFGWHTQVCVTVCRLSSSSLAFTW